MDPLAIFGMGPPCDVQFELDGQSTRKYANQSMTKFKEHSDSKLNIENIDGLPLFTESETVGGRVIIKAKDGKPFQHQGIKIEFVGSIELTFDRENSEFTTLERNLDDPGTITGTKQYRFEFTNVEKRYDTYSGVNVNLRYFLRFTIHRERAPDVIKTKDICVQHCEEPPESNKAIRLEVGIEDQIHMEFEYQQRQFHLKDVVVGRISFLLVELNIKTMEVEIRRKEHAGSGANVYNEQDAIMKFEVMDGAPEEGQVIPVRIFLGACKALTPTYRNINNKFSVRYFLNIVLVDVDDRRYFKQSEINIWRLAYETL